MPSPVEETYLESIYNMAMEDGRVRAVELAEKFRVSRPTVAQTLKRLVESGLIVQDRSSGVSLTDAGRTETEALLRRHRLAERLMFDVLGMDFINAHEQAHSLEHWISPEVEERIQNLLGAPRTCPHGNPIPGNAPGGIEYLRSQNAIRLASVKRGDRTEVVCISEVVEDETALLRRLMDTGIVPGRVLEIEGAGGDGVEYSCGGKRYRLEKAVAEKIWVRNAEQQDQSS